MSSDQKLLQQAFAALLKGDLTTRDKLCDRVIKRQEAIKKENTKLAMAVKPYFKEH